MAVSEYKGEGGVEEQIAAVINVLDDPTNTRLGSVEDQKAVAYLRSALFCLKEKNRLRAAKRGVMKR